MEERITGLDALEGLRLVLVMEKQSLCGDGENGKAQWQAMKADQTPTLHHFWQPTIVFTQSFTVSEGEGERCGELGFIVLVMWTPIHVHRPSSPQNLCQAIPTTHCLSTTWPGLAPLKFILDFSKNFWFFKRWACVFVIGYGLERCDTSSPLLQFLITIVRIMWWRGLCWVQSPNSITASKGKENDSCQRRIFFIFPYKTHVNKKNILYL